MSMTWPEVPGPDDWYVEVAPETPVEGSNKFSRVWVRIKCMAFPAHVCDFKAVALDGAKFDWQFDLAFKQAKGMVSRMNFARSREDPKSNEEVPCAECDGNALTDDYLCGPCREREDR